jgi:hypothetical protein
MLLPLFKEEGMKSLLSLWQKLADELASWCHTSTTRDYKTVTGRSETEGLSFLTITLTNFGADFQTALAQGFVDHNLFRGFAFQGGLPRFLGGFLDLCFDRSSGRLLDRPSHDAIYAIRQLTLMFGKMALECTPERVTRAIKGYVECEQSVIENDRTRTPRENEEFHDMAFLLFRDLFTQLDREVFEGDIVPKHGPGATADRLRANEKFNQLEWTSRLEKVFPAGDYLLPNWRYKHVHDQITWLEPGAERPVRVITVPKTLKTPRIIAIEPTCMQYMQQALLERFVTGLASDPLLDPFLRFSDQTPNQELARIGSLRGELATLDLSEASDRVSNLLVNTLFLRYPSLQAGIEATRSRQADVPGHGVIRLSKFASMGSALCFPIEAIVFLTCVFLGIQDELKRPLTRSAIRRFHGKVRVYGDDIIVPVEYVFAVVSRLEAFGFKVNKNKSFWSGYFRESCGKDYYEGTDVTIVRVRHEWPSRQQDAIQVASLVSLRNQFYLRGLWQTVRFLDEQIERLIPFPAVSFDSEALGKHSFLGHHTEKECPELQRPMVKAACLVTKIPENPLDDYGALMKFFLRRGDSPSPDKEHLLRSGRPDTVGIKIRWAYSAR